MVTPRNKANEKNVAIPSSSGTLRPPKFSLRKQSTPRAEQCATSPCTSVVRRAAASAGALTPLEAARIRATFYSSRTQATEEDGNSCYYNSAHSHHQASLERADAKNEEHEPLMGLVAVPSMHAKRIKRFKDVDAYLFGAQLSPPRGAVAPAAAAPAASPSAARVAAPASPSRGSPGCTTVASVPRPASDCAATSPTMGYHSSSHVRRSLQNQLLVEAKAATTPRGKTVINHGRGLDSDGSLCRPGKEKHRPVWIR